MVCIIYGDVATAIYHSHAPDSSATCKAALIAIETLVDFQYPESGKAVRPKPDQPDLYSAGPVNLSD